MKCAKCGMDNNGEFCGNCGNQLTHGKEPLYKRNRGLAVVVGSLVFIGIFLIGLFLIGIFPLNNSEIEPDLNISSSTISKAEYEQINNGMSYQEVCDIIGGEGELLSESGTSDDSYYVQIYMWQGNGIIGANANLTFMGGKLYTKAQSGLN